MWAREMPTHQSDKCRHTTVNVWYKHTNVRVIVGESRSWGKTTPFTKWLLKKPLTFNSVLVEAEDVHLNACSNLVATCVMVPLSLFSLHDFTNLSCYSPSHRWWTPFWGPLAANLAAPWLDSGQPGWRVVGGRCPVYWVEGRGPGCTAWDWPQPKVHTVL